MTKRQNKNFLHKEHFGVSPILATVMLLGITVVGGGMAFAVFSQGTNAASSSTLIGIDNAQAVKGTNHSDMTVTLKNMGSKAWKEVQMTVSKTELSEPILYESLHENVQGDNGATPGAPAKGIDNPLRSQWIAHLDKIGGTDGVADQGEGISAGRKFVAAADSSFRTTTLLTGTSVFKVLTGADATGDIDGFITLPTITKGTDFDASAFFTALDSSVGGTITCNQALDVNTIVQDIKCKVWTHKKISTIGSGDSLYLYADAFTNVVPGLNNVTVEAGDALTVNVVAKAIDGSDTRVQTIIKVVGL